MPDTFLRIFLYGAAAVAVGTGAIIATEKFGSNDTESKEHATAAVYAAAQRADATARALQPQWKSDADILAEPSAPAETVTPARAHGFRLHAEGGSDRAAADVAAAVAAVPPAREPLISFGENAVEFIVPVHPQSGEVARLPIALALAVDPTAVPPHVQETARKMAMDFFDEVMDAAAATTDPHNAAYHRRWESAAFLSDREFKMRYGRVAFVQMNKMVAQEAAAGIR